MPRVKRQDSDQPRFALSRELVRDLAKELKSDHSSGQPLIEEEAFGTGRFRVVVFWDRWHGVFHEDRTKSIMAAYRMVDPPEFADQIGLATGLTFPEAYGSGMLPFRVIPALRRGDLVTAEECRKAMIDEGASTLQNPHLPHLRFATPEDAEACVGRLSNRLPGSEQVWQTIQEIGQELDFTE